MTSALKPQRFEIQDLPFHSFFLLVIFHKARKHSHSDLAWSGVVNDDGGARVGRDSFVEEISQMDFFCYYNVFVWFVGVTDIISYINNIFCIPNKYKELM